MACTHAHDVLERLLAAHQAYFDVERDHEFAGRVFEGYAELHSSASQYVLSKRAKLWETNSHEYMFFVTTDTIDVPGLEDLVAFMKTSALDKVTLERDHMSSYLTLVVIAERTASDVERMVRRTRFRKNFLLGLRGWADLRICVVSLAEGTVCANAMGRDLVPTLRANAFETGA